MKDTTVTFRLKRTYVHKK